MVTSNFKGEQDDIVLPYARKAESWKYVNSTTDILTNMPDELALPCPTLSSPTGLSHAASSPFNHSSIFSIKPSVVFPAHAFLASKLLGP